jgi:hypothetical protein
MAKCKVLHCQKSYLGYVSKICAVCWDNFEVCPDCLVRYEKVVCKDCIAEGLRDDSVDLLKSQVDKYSLKQVMKDRSEKETEE